MQDFFWPDGLLNSAQQKKRKEKRRKKKASWARENQPAREKKGESRIPAGLAELGQKWASSVRPAPIFFVTFVFLFIIFFVFFHNF